MATKVEDASTVDEAVNKPMVYWDEAAQRFVYRASALFSCQNALLIARLGVEGHPPPVKLQQRYDEGHEQEALILRKLRKDFGFAPYGHQNTMELPAGKTAMVRGHVDCLSLLDGVALTSVDGEPCGVDYRFDLIGKIAVVDGKALAPGGYEEWKRHGFETVLYYLWQQGIYLYAGDWDAVVMAVKNKVTGELSVDLFTRKWYERRLPKATIIQRVLWVESQAKDPEKLFSLPCSPKMWPCPFYDMHPDNPTEVKEAGVEFDMDQMVDWVGKRQRHKADMEAAKATIETLDENIKGLVGGKVTTQPIHLRDWTVTTYHSGSAQTDWTAIALATNQTVAEAKKQFSSTVKSSKLTVKVVPKTAK